MLETSQPVEQYFKHLRRTKKRTSRAFSRLGESAGQVLEAVVSEH